ncbi:MarR family winged helix-turn-helix transcriptional regulator [Microcella sp.]|uniref:MarR family winged helix-turn-helix transcriptional regulator n=1 Tax=Microcella sp. TaxID=1913979 RepID=UPI003F716145
MAEKTPEPDDRVASIQREWARERPDVDVSPQGIIGRLHRISARLTDELAVVFRDYGISAGEFDVLAALRRAGDPFERTPTELAERTMITSGGLTKRVDRLEDAGLVQRRPSELDGRGRVVALTEQGRALIDDAFTRHMQNEHRLIELLDEADRRTLERVLTRWLARLPDDD